MSLQNVVICLIAALIVAIIALLGLGVWLTAQWREIMGEDVER